MTIDEILTIGFKGGASDIHLKIGLPPMFRINGALVALKKADRLSSNDLNSIVDAIMDERQKHTLRTQKEVDLAYGIGGVGRFRVNAYHQRGTLGMAIRVIPMKVPDFKGLMLPGILEKIAERNRGLILVTGTTSSGKSSTIAALINHINNKRTGHIMTIEDPIEFLIRDRMCMVNQREIGVDTLSYAAAIKSALRQDPDVILIGEMRDLETIETAIGAAETGHLVLSTLHTLDAAETINRVVSAFEPHLQKSIRLQLSSILQAVVSQRLVPRADKKGRVPAVEVMINTNRIRELIQDETRLHELRETIAAGHSSYGMQTFDQSLMSLLRNELITYDEAMKQATNPDDFALRMQGIAASGGEQWDEFEENVIDDDDDDDFELERFND